MIELETQIWPEISEKFPYVPIILVATKCDARGVEDEEEFWQIEGDSPNKSEHRFVGKKDCTVKHMINHIGASAKRELQ